MPTIFGMLRVRNEARWIERTVAAILPACERVFVLDDSSTDGTPEILNRMGEKVTVWESPFADMDESRDKQWMLDRMCQGISDSHLTGSVFSPYWVLAIDGDEEMTPESLPHLTVAAEGSGHAYRTRIPFLWNSASQVRVDGVYRSSFIRNGRPSLFRLFNRSFKFLKTPFGNGANFHCSSIPQELLGHALPTKITLKHWGYMNREDRLRKWDWYNTADPHNDAEDLYRHVIQQDVEERCCPHCDDVIPIPAGRLKHAGPLKVIPFDEAVAA